MARAPHATYHALRIDVAAHEAEAWSDALLDAGAMSVDAGDSEEGTAREIPLYDEGGGAARAWWPLSRVVALFDPGADAARALANAARALRCAVPPSRSASVADRDWVASVRAQFVPAEVATGVWIVPSWCAPVAVDAINITLDPGVAFGTGSHPTTRMCVGWLVRSVTAGDSVLDYGCGSGILAIAAARLGATRVEGVDIEPQAVRASADNAQANGVRASFHLANDARASRRCRHDVVVANILANPLRALAPLLAARSRSGGGLALAGILESQAGEVIDAYAPWFTIRCQESRDGWVLLAGIRRPRNR